MQYSPKLKKAMAKIHQILKDEDIAGVVVLHTPQHSEYLTHITPTYSCAEIDEQLGMLLIKGQLIHHNNDKKVQIQKLTDTCNMLHHLGRNTAQLGVMLIQASKQADKSFNATYDGGSETSNTTQNN